MRRGRTSTLNHPTVYQEAPWRTNHVPGLRRRRIASHDPGADHVRLSPKSGLEQRGRTTTCHPDSPAKSVRPPKKDPCYYRPIPRFLAWLFSKEKSPIFVVLAKPNEGTGDQGARLGAPSRSWTGMPVNDHGGHRVCRLFQIAVAEVWYHPELADSNSVRNEQSYSPRGDPDGHT